MKNTYYVLYIIGLTIYILSFFYYTLFVVNKRLTYETSYIRQINVNMRGGKIKYNSFILADKDYYLTRSKPILSSLLSHKELSQFDIETINRQNKVFSDYKQLTKISYFIDKIGNKKPYVPISLRASFEDKRDSWYYFTLCAYVAKSGFFLVLLTLNAILGTKVLLLGNNSGLVTILSLIGIIMVVIVVTVF